MVIVCSNSFTSSRIIFSISVAVMSFLLTSVVPTPFPLSAETVYSENIIRYIFKFYTTIGEEIVLITAVIIFLYISCNKD